MHIHLNGTRFWFDVEGPSLVPEGPAMRRRPTVILLHGGPGSFDHTYLKPDFSRLARIAQVVYLDMRGHGRSDHGDPGRWSYESCGDDIPVFCEALGIESPIVHGHSLGGFVTILYGARHPGHAAGLILDGTCARFDAKRLVENIRRLGGNELAEVAERVYITDEPVTREEWTPCWKLFGRWVPGPEERARVVANLDLNARGLPLMRDFDVRDQLGRIASPTLVIAGEDDPSMPVEASREIVAGLRPDRAQLSIIPNAGHFAWRDEPERYWPVVEEFVSRIGARTGAGNAATAAR